MTDTHRTDDHPTRAKTPAAGRHPAPARLVGLRDGLHCDDIWDLLFPDRS